MSEANDPVSFTVENRIAWVKFNRPEKRNCMNPHLNQRMLEVLDQLEFDDNVGVLVLSGEGAVSTTRDRHRARCASVDSRCASSRSRSEASDRKTAARIMR